MSSPVRDAIKRLMLREFSSSGKLEWTISEIVDGVEADGKSPFITRQHASNAFVALKKSGEAVQTRPIPRTGGPGSSGKYWALVACLDKATNPETKTEVTERPEMATPESTGNATLTEGVPSARKPRHDDASAHVIAEVVKVAEMSRESIVRELSLVMHDAEKALKVALQGLKGDSSAPTGEAFLKSVANVVQSGLDDMAKLGEKSQNELNSSMVQALAGIDSHYEKLAANVIESMTTIITVLQKAQGNDNAEMVGYRNGFADGWRQATNNMADEKILAIKRAGYDVEVLDEIEEKPNSNSRPEPASKPDPESAGNSSPLNEMLKKLGG